MEACFRGLLRVPGLDSLEFLLFGVTFVLVRFVPSDDGVMVLILSGIGSLVSLK